ncbi:hypothetical protein Droror1_Dr00006458 [Drosera rotundifolia]
MCKIGSHPTSAIGFPLEVCELNLSASYAGRSWVSSSNCVKSGGGERRKWRVWSATETRREEGGKEKAEAEEKLVRAGEGEMEEKEMGDVECCGLLDLGRSKGPGSLSLLLSH